MFPHILCTWTPYMAMVDSYDDRWRLGPWLSVDPVLTKLGLIIVDLEVPRPVLRHFWHQGITLNWFLNSNSWDLIKYCSDQENMFFWKFEFLNFIKTVNGHITGHILQIIMHLSTSQEGLSIFLLLSEKPFCKVNHIFMVPTVPRTVLTVISGSRDWLVI